MKKILACIIIAMSFSLLISCSSNKEVPIEKYTTDEIEALNQQLETFGKKYNAICYSDVIDSDTFSADIMDICKDRNILFDSCEIKDVYYENNQKHIILEDRSFDYPIVLELSDELHRKIKQTFIDGYFNCAIVLSIHSVDILQPEINGFFNIDITNGEYSYDCDEELTLTNRIIRGSLIDFMYYDDLSIPYVR